MHIDEYKEYIKAQIDGWVEEYKKENEGDSINWPLERDEPDWMEDFLNWY